MPPRHWLALALPLLLGARASAATFDFDLFPDAVYDPDGALTLPLGCSAAVTAGDYATAHALCAEDDAIANMEAGLSDGFVDTEGGLTLTLSAGSQSVIWDGAIRCGNTSDCGAYLADFSVPLSSVSLEMFAAFQDGHPVDAVLSLYLEAWSEAGATGELLGSVLLPGVVPATLAFSALPGQSIGSIRFGASALVLGDSGCDPCVNLGAFDDLVATPVPEPASAALVMLGLTVCTAMRRHRRAR